MLVFQHEKIFTNFSDSYCARFLCGVLLQNIDLFEAVSQHPRGGLNIPAQWFMMESAVGWERMMFVFGYADNIEVCEHLVEVAKAESPERNFRCTDAN